MGGLGRPLRDVLHDEDPRPQLTALFGEFDEARVDATLAAVRDALAAAFPADAVVSRYVLEGAAPVTRITATADVAAARILDLADATPPRGTPSLEARLDLGCLASISVRRASPSDTRPFDHDERRLFAAIVALVRRPDSPL